jgi:hypothetical protein
MQMVGPLKRFARDPEGKGRGAGLYYHRGKGKWSKYSPQRDRRYKAPLRRKRKKSKDWRTGAVGSGPYRHTHDRTKSARKQARRTARKVLSRIRKRTLKKVKKK